MGRQRKLIICSLFLGFGLGMMVSSVFNFLHPTITYKEYSEEEIKNIAREMGMIELEEYYELMDKIAEYESLESSKKNNEEDKDRNVEQNESITFEIKKGETSEEIIQNLYDMGIIEDKIGFEKLVIERKAERRFIYGIYEIKKNMGYDELLDILCDF